MFKEEVKTKKKNYIAEVSWAPREVPVAGYRGHKQSGTGPNIYKKKPSAVNGEEEVRFFNIWHSGRYFLAHLA